MQKRNRYLHLGRLGFELYLFSETFILIVHMRFISKFC